MGCELDALRPAKPRGAVTRLQDASSRSLSRCTWMRCVLRSCGEQCPGCRTQAADLSGRIPPRLEARLRRNRGLKARRTTASAQSTTLSKYVAHLRRLTASRGASSALDCFSALNWSSLLDRLTGAAPLSRPQLLADPATFRSPTSASKAASRSVERKTAEGCVVASAHCGVCSSGNSPGHAMT